LKETGGKVGKDNEWRLVKLEVGKDCDKLIIGEGELSDITNVSRSSRLLSLLRCLAFLPWIHLRKSWLNKTSAELGRSLPKHHRRVIFHAPSGRTSVGRSRNPPSE
jgi:hypothetical protein